ncbi:MAG: ATP-binding cassette domain-containing protein [Neisseriaceae bacterium]|nr:ATP-binding cassette domain-containing protein [Neisseriaceae bacterium]
MSILSIENLHFAVGHHALLDGVFLTLNAGDKVGIVGRNGSGKSSLLKIIAGKMPSDDGKISIQNGLKTVFVPQEMPFDEHASVFDVVSSGLGEIQGDLQAYHHLSQKLAHNPHDEKLLNQFQQVTDKIDLQDGWAKDAVVAKVLTAFRLPENGLVQALSGGQKKRLALAWAFVQEPDILLLDEPTNHLDIDAIFELEQMLNNFSGSLIVITHDRQFLDSVVCRIAELDRGRLKIYDGNFSYYSKRKEEELAAEETHNRLFDKFHAQEEAWIRRGIEARRTRNQGRVKRLENLRRERLQRRERQGNMVLRLDKGDAGGKIVAELESVSFSYENQIIINNFSAVFQRGDKIGLIGKNGVGKTTFLRLVLGELSPQIGRVRLGLRNRVAYFDQMRSTVDENETVFRTIGQGNDFVEISGKKRHITSYLGDFLFEPQRLQSPVSSLSGGERNRLLLAKLFTQPANILVLDEPTNDLDIDSVEVLENCLQEYDGTVFLVSHDRRFLDSVITSSVVFLGDGNLKEYIGGFEDYQAARKRELATQNDFRQPEKVAVANDTRPKRKTDKLSFNEQRELDALPDEIDKLEQQVTDLQQQLADGSLFKTDYQKALQMQEEIAQIEQILEEKINRWTELESKAEALKKG